MRPYLLLILILPLLVQAEPEPAEAPITACRSVHLQYPSPPSEWAILDVTVKQSAPGTYFCALGFHNGYFGLQELHNGKKVIIFSVWDNVAPFDSTAHPDKTEENLRAGVVAVGEGVVQSRFGGEGTGCKSMFDYDWNIDQPVRFAVHSKIENGSGTYTAFFYDSKRNIWQLMASFRTPSGSLLNGLYSFVEDFVRDEHSTTLSRRAEYKNAWTFANNKWTPLLKAQFTADPTPSFTINAETIPDGFALQTGGDTKNTHIRLWDNAERETPSATTPSGLEELPGLKTN